MRWATIDEVIDQQQEELRDERASRAQAATTTNPARMPYTNIQCVDSHVNTNK